ncbi:MAG: DUF86 domain-containing protein, partial [Bacilli bacterium]|nr:DUF86 domain-containing protein [Bacilli bacterium]
MKRKTPFLMVTMPLFAIATLGGCNATPRKSAPASQEPEESKPLEAYPEIPWVQIYDMRNFISHEYANIDEAIVFSAIKDDLPRLHSAVVELLKR